MLESIRINSCAGKYQCDPYGNERVVGQITPFCANFLSIGESADLVDIIDISQFYSP